MTFGSDHFGLGPGTERPWAHSTANEVWEGRREEAQRTIDGALDDAMGGPPDDVFLRMVTLDGRPARALVGFAGKDDDLLVVGASRPRLRRPFHPSVGRYCMAHATCPVLVVPPHEVAQELTRQKWHWNAMEKTLDEDAVSRSTR